MMGRTTLKKQTTQVVALGLFLGSLWLVGHGGVGVASAESGPLQIDHESVSGTVTHMPLQIILDQFHEQLGIAYKASKEELDKPVSVELYGESVEAALAKILAPWDYAFQADAAGRIQQVFVVRKVVAGGAEEQAIKAEAGQRLTSKTRWGRTRARRQAMEEPSVALQESSPAPFETSSFSRPNTPPVLPHQLEERRREAMEEAGMNIFPPTSYPEMEVAHVSEAEAQGILQSFNIPDDGAANGTSSPGMEMWQVSAAEAQGILQSFNIPDAGAATGASSLGMEMRHLSAAEKMAMLESFTFSPGASEDGRLP